MIFHSVLAWDQFSALYVKKKKKISHRHWGPLRGNSSPFSPLSQRGLTPIKPVYDPDRPDGRLNITASAFNQLGQYTSSPGRRGYCYAELAVFFPSGGRNHRQYSLRLPTEGWPGWIGLVAGYVMRQFTCPKAVTHPSTNRAQCRATALIETNALLLH